jgi:hypothetical protein
MKLKNTMRKASAILFGACIFSWGGAAALLQTSYVYAVSGTGVETGAVASAGGYVKTGNGYVKPTHTPANPNPGTGTPGTSFEAVPAVKQEADKKVKEAQEKANKEEEEKEKKEKEKSENKSGKKGDESSGASDTSQEKSYVEVSAAMPDMSLGKTKKANIKKIANTGKNLILDVFVLVGFVMIVASSGMLVFAFKDESADAKLRGAMGLATGVALIGIFTIFKTVGIMDKL